MDAPKIFALATLFFAYLWLYVGHIALEQRHDWLARGDENHARTMRIWGILATILSVFVGFIAGVFAVRAGIF